MTPKKSTTNINMRPKKHNKYKQDTKKNNKYKQDTKNKKTKRQTLVVKRIL